jgi:quercetin dioxygenase-like cupin family protein
MKLIEIESLPPVSLPSHKMVFSRRVWDPENGAKQVAIGYNFLFSNGGAEEHSHDSEHVFIILSGSCEFEVNNKIFSLNAGQVVVIEPGERHRISGNGREDCCYLTVTSPPFWNK